MSAAVRTETVAAAMVTIPKTHSPSTTVGEARAFFADDHVHMMLLVADDGCLRGTVVREDLGTHLAHTAPAQTVATLQGRVVGPGEPLRDVRAHMVSTGQRRLAVIDEHARLRGLLCLKGNQSGFCTDAGVIARVSDCLDQVRTAGTPTADSWR